MTDMQIFREKCVRGVSVLWYDENGEVIRQLKGGISPAGSCGWRSLGRIGAES